MLQFCFPCICYLTSQIFVHQSVNRSFDVAVYVIYKSNIYFVFICEQSGIVEMIVRSGFILVVLRYCSCQEYDLNDDYSDHLDSIQDDAAEVFNVTAEHKPERIVKHLNDNVLNNDEDTKKGMSILKESIEKPRKPALLGTTQRITSVTAEIKRCAINANSEMSGEEPGSKGPVNNYPYAVSLQMKGSHYATGALVGSSWVLTSAGEFYNVRESIKVYRARLGSVDCKKGGVVVPLKRIEIHPSYILGKPNYDVALIGLAREVEFTDSIKPIAFTKIENKLLSAKFTSTYWPRLVVKGKVLPVSAKERVKFNSMRVSSQHLIPWDKCYRAVNLLKEVLSESNLCLKPVVTHHSVCSPDVGAPIASDDGLWGVTSGWVSKLCTKYPSPTVATRISSPLVRSWLNAVLNDHH